MTIVELIWNIWLTALITFGSGVGLFILLIAYIIWSDSK